MSRTCFHAPRSAVAVLSLIVLASGLGRLHGQPSPLPLFSDESASRLPTTDLMGFTMDAMLADLDGDSDVDIVLAIEFRPNILLVNTGFGSFVNESLERIPQVRRDSEDIAIADFDRNGSLDIVVVSEDDRINELYLNDGNGVFSDAGDRIPVAGRSNAVLAADLDGRDGPDIIIGNNGQNTILMNDGNGFFVDETASRLPAVEDVTQDIELGDIDGDDDLDLLVGNEGRNRLLENVGEGFFEDVSEGRLPVPESPEETREADLGDVDGDTDLDIFFANARIFVPQATLRNRLLLNTDGVFTDHTAERLPPDEDVTMDGDFVDIDDDGDLDILTANFDDIGGVRAEAPYRVYRNTSGFFTDATSDIFPDGVVGNGLDIEARDVTGDGDVDLYLSSRGGSDRLIVRVRDADSSCVCATPTRTASKMTWTTAPACRIHPRTTRTVTASATRASSSCEATRRPTARSTWRIRYACSFTSFSAGARSRVPTPRTRGTTACSTSPTRCVLSNISSSERSRPRRRAR